MTNAIFIPKFGAADVFEWRETSLPELAADQVQIRVHAAGVNFADILMRQGLYPEAPDLPFIPGYEISGIVEKTGANTLGFQPGDRVLAITRFGGYAQRVQVRQDYTRKIPDWLDYRQAAAIPVNYLTAYVALFHMGKLQKDQSVFIHHVFGGVGLAATQLAKSCGARVIGTTGSNSKLHLAGQFQIDHVFNPSEKDLAKEVRKFTSGEGCDLVLDATGTKNLKKDFQALKPTGAMVLFGVSSIIKPGKRHLLHAAVNLFRSFYINPIWLMSQNRGIYGLNLLKLYAHMDILSESIAHIERLLAEKKIQPIVSQSFPMADAALAHHYLENRQNVGKVVLVES